jgi:hypothetical protein
MEYGAMPVVRIITSSVNGAGLGPELLPSISEQRGANVTRRIREDGPTDSTREILPDASRHMHVHELAGSNNGDVSDFLELLQTCPKDADFHAFYEPDDVWLGMLGLRALLAAALHPSRVLLESAESVDQAPSLAGFGVRSIHTEGTPGAPVQEMT